MQRRESISTHGNSYVEISVGSFGSQAYLLKEWMNSLYVSPTEGIKFSKKATKFGFDPSIWSKYALWLHLQPWSVKGWIAKFRLQCHFWGPWTCVGSTILWPCYISFASEKHNNLCYTHVARHPDSLLITTFKYR